MARKVEIKRDGRGKIGKRGEGGEGRGEGHATVNRDRSSATMRQQAILRMPD